MRRLARRSARRISRRDDARRRRRAALRIRDTAPRKRRGGSSSSEAISGRSARRHLARCVAKSTTPRYATGAWSGDGREEKARSLRCPSRMRSPSSGRRCAWRPCARRGRRTPGVSRSSRPRWRWRSGNTRPRWTPRGAARTPPSGDERACAAAANRGPIPNPTTHPTTRRPSRSAGPRRTWTIRTTEEARPRRQTAVRCRMASPGTSPAGPPVADREAE